MNYIGSYNAPLKPLGSTNFAEVSLDASGIAPGRKNEKSWIIMENHGHNNYGYFWQFYGEIIFK